MSKIEKHANEIVEILESALINGSIPSKFLLDKEESEFDNSKLTPEEHIDKVYKADYLTLQTKMV
jgi:hypothetical protein